MTEQKQLRLEVISEDDELIQLLAFATNGRYCGTTEVYTTAEELAEFADALEGFPRVVTDTVDFGFGKSGDYAFFGLRFYCVNGVGQTAVQVTVEEKVTHAHARPEEKHRASFELRYDAGLIDQFLPAVRRMAQTRYGQASLF